MALYRPEVTVMVSPDEHGFLIHHSPHTDGENQAPARRADAAQPKAAPLSRARTMGNRTPVTVTMVLGRGGGGWVMVTTAQGTFRAPMDETLWSLMSRVIQGNYRPVKATYRERGKARTERKRA